MRPLIAKVQEVPESILLDRAAKAEGVVPQLQQTARRAESRGLQLRCVVGADHAFADPGEEQRPTQRVSARLRDDAERRPGHFGVAEAGGHREGDFLRVGDVRVVAGHAAAISRRADAKAVHLQASFVAIAPTGGAEDDHAGRGLHVGRRRALCLNRRHEQHDAAIPARGGYSAEYLAGDGGLPAHALHVNHRRLAGHRNRFLHGADAKVCADRRGHQTGQLDALALDSRKAGQRERHRIRARPQIDDLVAAVPVGDRGTNLLDEHVARRFDGDAGQHRTGGVTHEPGNGGLRPRCRGHQREDHEGNADPGCTTMWH